MATYKRNPKLENLSMAMVQFSKFKHVLQTVVMIGLIAYLIHSINFRELGKILVNLKVGWIIVPIVLHIGAVWLNAYRWLVLLKNTSQVRIPLWRFAFSQIVGQFFNVFLPSDMGGDVYKMYDINKFYNSYGKSIASVILTRVFGFLAMGLLLALGLMLSHMVISEGSVFWIALVYSFFSIVGIILLIEKKILGFILEKFILNMEIKNRFINKCVGVVHEFNLIFISRKTILISLLLGLSFQILLQVIVFFYGVSIGVIIPFMSLFIIVPLIMLVSAIPVSINSLGLREGAYVYFLAWVGLTNEQGMTIALLSRLTSGIIIPLIGGILYLIFRRSVNRIFIPDSNISPCTDKHVVPERTAF